MHLDKGLVHVYTGNGKGKTSLSLGMCFRAVGRGLKCCFIQFVKGIETGELIAAKYLPNFEFIQTGRPNYNFEVIEEDYERAKKGLELAYQKMNDNDMLVLDEINVAVYLGLLSIGEVTAMVRSKPRKLELILTGRHARPEVIELADYVTVLELVKHPFYKGINARKGVDY